MLRKRRSADYLQLHLAGSRLSTTANSHASHTYPHEDAGTRDRRVSHPPTPAWSVLRSLHMHRASTHTRVTRSSHPFLPYSQEGCFPCRVVGWEEKKSGVQGYKGTSQWGEGNSFRLFQPPLLLLSFSFSPFSHPLTTLSLSSLSHTTSSLYTLKKPWNKTLDAAISRSMHLANAPAATLVSV